MHDCGDGYEYSEPITISGIVGTPKFPSPYNTDCEYCIQCISFTDVGVVFCGPDQWVPTPGNTWTTAGSEYGQRGRVYQATAAGIVGMSAIWTKLAGNFLYFNFIMTNSHAAHVVLVFRRRLVVEQLIPALDGAETSAEQIDPRGRNIGQTIYDNGRQRHAIDVSSDAGRGVRTRER